MNRVTKRSLKQQENYEHVLMCLICRSLFDDHDHQPKFLPCHHTFCKECLREYVRQMGDEIECPSCRKAATIPAAGVAALQTNFYAKYIQSLVYGCGAGGEGMLSECERHPSHTLRCLCKDCGHSVCDVCIQEDDRCAGHRLVPLTTATEEYHQKIDASFANANSLIERKKVELEALLKALSEEKDQSLLKIDSTFEQYVHTLNRRATLLKNKVIDIYNEHTTKLDADLEEISTAMTCVVSLKEYHEKMISHGDFTDVEKGIEELDEVCRNVQGKILLPKNQILFEDRHGADKFRGGVKDLGRVICKSVAAKAAEKPDETGSSGVVNTEHQSPAVTPNNPSEGDEGNSVSTPHPTSSTTFELPRKEMTCDDTSKLEVKTTLGEEKSKELASDVETTASDLSKSVITTMDANTRTAARQDKTKSKQECNNARSNPDGERDKSNENSTGNLTSRAKADISQPSKAISFSLVNNNDPTKQGDCPEGFQRSRSSFTPESSSSSSKGFCKEELRHPSPRRGVGDGGGMETQVKGDYWMPASSSLDGINAEMSPEQTTL